MWILEKEILFHEQTLEEFNQKFHGMKKGNKLISTVMSACWNMQRYERYNCFNNTMRRYLDIVGLIINDMTGPWLGVHTGAHSDWYYFEHSINHRLVKRELPAGNLVAGVPLKRQNFQRNISCVR